MIGQATAAERADDLLDAGEVAALLGVSIEWVRARALVLPAVVEWATCQVRVRRGDLAAWRAAAEQVVWR